MVLGFAEGAQWGHYGWKPLDQDPDYPKDSVVCRRVLSTARRFNDLYPLLSRVEAEPPFLAVPPDEGIPA